MAGSFIRRATKTVFLCINLLVAVIFLLSCLTPFAPTSTWWILGFTGLVVPYAIVILFFLIIISRELTLISQYLVLNIVIYLLLSSFLIIISFLWR